MLDAAGAMSTVPKNHSLEGSSLLCLVSDASGKSCAAAAKGQAPEGGGWREWVDLEHNTCYNNTNHWSALTDGTSRP